MLRIWMLPLAAAVDFPQFDSADNHYKCNAFLNEEIDDHIMACFYSLVNGLIRLLSRPFPHEQLLSERILQGELGDLRSSFVNKPHELPVKATLCTKRCWYLPRVLVIYESMQRTNVLALCAVLLLFYATACGNLAAKQHAVARVRSSALRTTTLSVRPTSAVSGLSSNVSIRSAGKGWQQKSRALDRHLDAPKFEGVWIAYEQWWILLASSLVLFGILFSFFYLIYSCCTCCCYSQLTEKTTDSRYDVCKRHLLNSLISVIVIANIFAVSSLLISSQYAEYGASELPHRVGNCLDDLSLYKRNTDVRIRRLLVDDFQLLNASMVGVMSTAGSWLINRVKQMSGAQAIDQLEYAYETSREMQERIADLQSQIVSLNNELLRFRIDFVKLRRASSRELNECLNGDNEVTMSFCRRAEKILDDIDDFPLTVHQASDYVCVNA